MAIIQERLRAAFKKPSYVNYNNNSSFGMSTVGQTYPYNRAPGRGVMGAINMNKNNVKFGSLLNRLERFLDYEMMDTHPLVSNALDIISDDVVTQDYSNDILDIKSDNKELVSELENLFFNILDVDYNLWFWARNMVKYGDCYIMLQVEKELGIVNGISLPPNFVERTELLTDAGDYTITFMFQGATQPFGEGQILDFRIIGDEKFLPYGKSVLEPARRTWKLLRMMEDSMMIYRVTRAPERRIFYLDVGNMSPDAIESYVSEVRDSTQAMPVINPETGDVDIRYGPTSITQDFYIPTRGGSELNKIDVLKGGENANATEDIKFILDELLSALKVPKSFMGYEATTTRNNLSAEEIRYARTIQRIQKMLVNELYKAAYVHLSALGYKEEDMMEFELNLFNPSQIYELQKLEVLKAKAETATQLVPFFSQEYLLKEIFGMSDDDIKLERIRKIHELKYQAFIETMQNFRGIDLNDTVKTLTTTKFNYDEFFNPETEKKMDKAEDNSSKIRANKILRKDPEQYQSNKFGDLRRQTKDMTKPALYDQEISEKDIIKEDAKFVDYTNKGFFISKIKKIITEKFMEDTKEINLNIDEEII